MALDAVPAASLPQLRVIGDVGLISRSVEAALRAAGFAPPWLSDWLSEDIVFLARWFQNRVGAGRLLVRLETVDDDACRRFHADNVRFRLVTTYRGPGTQWLSPADANGLEDDQTLSADRIRRLERGHVAILRGAREATPDHPGLLHRSPPIEGSGVTRLFLAIDDARDHEH